MNAPTISRLGNNRLTADEIEASISTLTAAFVADPVIRWMYPDTRQYLGCFPRFLHAFGGRAFEMGTVKNEAENRATALWLAPGMHPDDEAIEACLLETVATERHGDLFKVFEDMDRAHPDFEHWYLPWFGTDPRWQSQGVGSQLLRDCLMAVDHDRLPAYLETPNPRNIAFYQRHGFSVIGLSQHGDCPTVTFMLREATSR
ncbi:MAG: GNAT family N-acetyltransferase [Erythrobacter sp.]